MNSFKQYLEIKEQGGGLLKIDPNSGRLSNPIGQPPAGPPQFLPPPPWVHPDFIPLPLVDPYGVPYGYEPDPFEWRELQRDEEFPRA